MNGRERNVRRIVRVTGTTLASLLFLSAGCATNPDGTTEYKRTAIGALGGHPWWYDQVKREHFSGGDFTSNFDKDKPGESDYQFRAPEPGEYEFWVRANPLLSTLSYSLNGGPETVIDLSAEKRGEVNVAADNKPDLRFLAWCKAGKVPLRSGENSIRFRMTSQNNNHGYLDCFVVSTEWFQPRGLLKPDQLLADSRQAAAEQKTWFAFDPKPDPFAQECAIAHRTPERRRRPHD